MSDFTAAADALNMKIKQAEAHIASLKMGVRAEVDIGEGFKLGWGKVNKVWHLYIVTKESGNVPLDSTPLKLRLVAVRHLKALIDALNYETESQIDRINEAQETLDVFIDAFVAQKVNSK